MSNPVLESAQYITENAQHVSVNSERCIASARQILETMKRNSGQPTRDGYVYMGDWSAHPLNFSPATETTPKGPKVLRTSGDSHDVNAWVVDWLFTVDLLNFSFWSAVDVADSGKPDAASGRFAVEYKGNSYTGYWSLLAAIKRALDQGDRRIISPQFWASSEFTETYLADVFRVETEEQVPMLSERFRVLQEAGRVITEKWGADSVVPIVSAAGRSATELVRLLTENFGSFRDQAVYKDKAVYIYKRVQIFVADLWACFRGQSFGEFGDIDSLTMFADYRVPQILYQLGCIEYDAELLKALWSRQMLPNGSEMEVEIRGVSIWSVEVIKREMERIIATEPAFHGLKVNSIVIDFYLWDTAKQIQKERAETGKNAEVPCHLTRSCFY